jgi:hypothetical protein
VFLPEVRVAGKKRQRFFPDFAEFEAISPPKKDFGRGNGIETGRT